jgi:anti-sigma B factor antagonist
MLMPVNGFDATVRDRGGVAVIDMTGEVNSQAEQELDAAYAAAEDLGTSQVLLNFKDVDYINSTGIALIVGILARARKNRREVLACGLQEHYKKIFEITRVADFMQIYEDEDRAVADGAAS